ncbi:aldehyde dehydrogenase family protein [Paenibacillus thiaminolyticus]|uniref:Aldehyde dehydrogenase EutE n=1 Tax=Paenibacillus thiaminolyticus TaxID=49283 RepID=A0A3A3GLM3_PANTH|nr:aldehyde dehydrogenase family protein [Paenibacillus thiaminolyticus]RJG25572.1 aldehyde dehydrogenase EutE [Paenibacillus thiaminolyticus]
MGIKLSESDIQSIIQGVLRNIEQNLPGGWGGQAATNHAGIRHADAGQAQPEAEVTSAASAEKGGEWGVFAEVEAAIDAASEAQTTYIRQFNLQDRERFIAAIRRATLEQKDVLASMTWKETKLGRYEDKIEKLELTAAKTPGTEDLIAKAFTGDDGLTLVKEGPFGVIGAVTPVTNPVETVINNAIGMLAAGNAVVFNVHPSSKACCAYAVQMMNRAVQEAGGPANLVTMVKEPTKDTLDAIAQSPKVQLLVGTGGPGLVRALLRSGKKAIGAGSGNPPVIVDDTADIERAAQAIIAGASFENNILCIAEKEVFVVDKVADDLLFHMLNHGAYQLDDRELEQVMSFTLEVNESGTASSCSLDAKREYHTVKEWIGKDAALFLDKIDVAPDKEVKLLICEVDFDHPFVQLEQMMPILPIVRVSDLEEAIRLAVLAEHGNRHTALMHSTNVANLAAFERAIGTTIFVKNASSLAGVGSGGEGFTTMTIAGPTGEGLTSARTFTRKMRSVLAERGT